MTIKRMNYRANWKLIESYLEYRSQFDRLKSTTVEQERKRLAHFLIWADDTLFAQVHKKVPTFPEYVSKLLNHAGKPITAAYAKRLLTSVQRLFRWLAENKRGFSKQHLQWITTLQVPDNLLESPRPNVVTLNDIRAIAQAPIQYAWEYRIRAAAAFLFLSGMRINAFVTLPLKAVDLEAKTVKQWPEWGVKTKNSLRATTYLINPPEAPELWEIILDWDTRLRQSLSSDDLWFAHLSTETGWLDPNPPPIGKHRPSRFRKDFKRWTKRVGLPHYNPHAFRHGFTHYAGGKTRTTEEFKAVSQNLMHKTMETTSQYYLHIQDDDVKNVITNLGHRSKETTDEEQLAERVAAAVLNALNQQSKSDDNENG
ncbi:MAG TPA: tyrosine-type recombinase/integrase [Anaerolineae bacterium]|nr:tyrosine-type recombinase/integrase [Anaerolineae bacterium]